MAADGAGDTSAGASCSPQASVDLLPPQPVQELEMTCPVASPPELKAEEAKSEPSTSTVGETLGQNPSVDVDVNLAASHKIHCAWV